MPDIIFFSKSTPNSDIVEGQPSKFDWEGEGLSFDSPVGQTVFEDDCI